MPFYILLLSGLTVRCIRRNCLCVFSIPYEGIKRSRQDQNSNFSQPSHLLNLLLFCDQVQMRCRAAVVEQIVQCISLAHGSPRAALPVAFRFSF